MGRFSRYYLYLAWLITLIATMSTLYLSIIRGIPVCNLCWYQRICLYPLAILLGIAAYREDSNIIFYALPLTALGFLFSLYQYLEQMIPNFTPIAFCGAGPDCHTIHFQLLKFITWPFLSLLATVAIAFLLFFYRLFRTRGK